MRPFLLIPVVLALMIGSVILSQSAPGNPHGQLPWDCQDCHTTESWSRMRDSLVFDHNATGFHLSGAHGAARCASCHKDPVFSHVGTSCIDCHADHHSGALGTDCQRCHTPRDWQSRQSTLQMHAANGFPLVGTHAIADCEACHVGHAREEYGGTPVDCYGCHRERYEATQEPNHRQAGFSHQCQECHAATATDWRTSGFDHAAIFPLTGAHVRTACVACHGNGYAGTPTDCYECHNTDFAATAQPDHETGGFSHQCNLCHTTAAWQPATYDHTSTAFPLTGAHARAACVACHATQFAGTPTSCYACHQSDFDGTTEPDHQLAQFDHNCTSCHTTTSWQPSSFDHSTTGFALTGRHMIIVCSQCHSSTFAGTPTTCYDCHQADFAGVSDPNHVQQGFSHDCTSCHSTSGWSPSTFDHATTSFPLTGKHLTATCIACHISGYAGTVSTCYACHQTAYDGAASPSHAAAGFPTTCQTCHTTGGWTPSTWDHDALYFPITSGHHAGFDCADCHVNPSAYASFSCTDCHEHNRTDTDQHHQEVNNYQYLSTACYECHPRGRT
jgi:hypothetical protein